VVREKLHVLDKHLELDGPELVVIFAKKTRNVIFGERNFVSELFHLAQKQVRPNLFPGILVLNRKSFVNLNFLQ
jgi:hypothetical protein